MPLTVFFIAMILNYFLGGKIVNETVLDIILHILGGMSICLSMSGVLWHLVRRELIVLQDEKVFRFLVFGFLCFVVISWEIFEYIAFYPDDLLTYNDTIADMIFGLIGGLFVMFFIRKLVN